MKLRITASPTVTDRPLPQMHQIGQRGMALAIPNAAASVIESLHVVQ